jgi:hypothetical protein
MTTTNKTLSAKITNLIPKEFCQFFTHVLMIQSLAPKKPDPQVPNSLTRLDHEVMFDTILERLWPTVESVAGEELLPTYAFARLYCNGNALEKHIDRPACEVSVTIQLGRSHHYAWPIYVGGERFDLAEGDGVFYRGCEVEHWRNVCDGPNGYYSGQLFLHYVRKNGQYADQAGDEIHRPTPAPLFMKNRTHLMEGK